MVHFWKRRTSSQHCEKMPHGRPSHSPLLKPFSALATPGMYLFSKYNEYKRQQQEQQKRKVTEKELENLNQKIDRLLSRIDDRDADNTITEEEECVICLGAKATMQTYPCGHKVVCRKCFIKTIQVAVSQRSLPLRCVICRSRILKLRQAALPPMQVAAPISGRYLPKSPSIRHFQK
ncbi:mitochondrial ubiquitin ligase activator of NFKB 1-like [Haliotis rufescens]|uniref:mitochondrial ubiquitin ligase activator of NFKB 1-like n=1 Tax=Haliotis rufescens TaxID=6454 RepID=UPI001EAFC4A6|nr:mitochondrial ubiquitin ligase activator of NFKB 1-like [Haliotis rufescens]